MFISCSYSKPGLFLQVLILTLDADGYSLQQLAASCPSTQPGGAAGLLEIWDLFLRHRCITASGQRQSCL